MTDPGENAASDSVRESVAGREPGPAPESPASEVTAPEAAASEPPGAAVADSGASEPAGAGVREPAATAGGGAGAGGRGGDAGTSGAVVTDGVWPQVRDAVTIRSALLVIATLGLGIGFILSYVGGLHHPAPKNLPFDVVAPAQVQSQAVAGLAGLPGQSLTPRLIADADTARARVADRTSTGALVIDPTSSADTLYVASGAGPSISNALIKIVGAAEAKQQRTVNVVDLVPVSAGDSSGLSSFYLAVGWTVAGYLIASILGVSAGTRPATPTRAVVRLVALALSAVVGGGVGAWLVQDKLGALPGGFWSLAVVGALVVFGAGAVTMALQIAFGVVGIGIAVLMFVILGNPAAGGAYARALMPPFWRAIGAFLPPGAGTDAARSVAYFSGAHNAEPLFVLSCYVVVGLLATIGLAVMVRPKAKAAPKPGSVSAPGTGAASLPEGV